MISEATKNEYLDVLDRAQAFNILEYNGNHDLDIIVLNNYLKELQTKYYIKDEIDVKSCIDKINRWIYAKLEMSTGDVRRDIERFVLERNIKFNIEEVLEEINHRLGDISNDNFNILEGVTEIKSKFEKRRILQTKSRESTCDLPILSSEIQEDIRNLKGKQEKILYFFNTLPKNTELSVYDIRKVLSGIVSESGGNTIHASVSHLIERGKLKKRVYSPPHSVDTVLYYLPD